MYVRQNAASEGDRRLSGSKQRIGFNVVHGNVGNAPTALDHVDMNIIGTVAMQNLKHFRVAFLVGQVNPQKQAAPGDLVLHAFGMMSPENPRQDQTHCACSKTAAGNNGKRRDKGSGAAGGDNGRDPGTGDVYRHADQCRETFRS